MDGLPFPSFPFFEFGGRCWLFFIGSAVNFVLLKLADTDVASLDWELLADAHLFFFWM
jgi:hypothetical protein